MATVGNRVFTHGVIPGSRQTKARRISSPGSYEAILMWPLTMMESGYGTLCRTGRIAEADSDLHRRSDRKDQARRGGSIRPGGDRRIHQIACVACRTDWARDRTNGDVAMDRAE